MVLWGVEVPSGWWCEDVHVLLLNLISYPVHV